MPLLRRETSIVKIWSGCKLSDFHSFWKNNIHQMFVHFVLCIFQANVQNGGSVPAQFSKLSLFRLWWFGAATFLLLVTQQAWYIEGISICCSSASALRLLLLLDNTKPIGEEIRWPAKKVMIWLVRGNTLFGQESEHFWC